jgi:ABC-type uncharacterized transport system ATPase subunit
MSDDFPPEASGQHTYNTPCAGHILCDVNFTVPRGETIGLTGRNGMGETAPGPTPLHGAPNGGCTVGRCLTPRRTKSHAWESPVFRKVA